MKVSIITVSYNSEKTIQKTIDSVNNQDYSDIEHIIIDGNSSDKTKEIIKSNSNKIAKYISEPDGGIYDAMNKGINLSTGEIIGTLNSDDVFYSNKTVKNVAHVFKQKDDIECLYGNLVFVNTKNKIVRRWNSRVFEPGLFEKSWTPAHPTFYCRREVFDKFGLYKTDYKIAADVEFMLRLLEIERINPCFLDETLVKMRIGGISNAGLKSLITITKEMNRAFEENNRKLNLIKYLFYKFIKVKEYIF